MYNVEFDSIDIKNVSILIIFYFGLLAERHKDENSKCSAGAV